MHGRSSSSAPVSRPIATRSASGTRSRTPQPGALVRFGKARQGFDALAFASSSGQAVVDDTHSRRVFSGLGHEPSYAARRAEKPRRPVTPRSRDKDRRSNETAYHKNAPKDAFSHGPQPTTHRRFDGQDRPRVVRSKRSDPQVNGPARVGSSRQQPHGRHRLLFCKFQDLRRGFTLRRTPWGRNLFR